MWTRSEDHQGFAAKLGEGVFAAKFGEGVFAAKFAEGVFAAKSAKSAKNYGYRFMAERLVGVGSGVLVNLMEGLGGWAEGLGVSTRHFQGS